MNRRKYMAIPPGAVLPGALPEFRIYVLTPQGSYTLWALKGNKVTPEQLARLAEGGYTEVYVDLEEEFKYEQYLESNLGSILENQAASEDQKAEIFSRVSTNVVKGAFETSLGLGAMGAIALQRTQKLIENALKFIVESKSLQALSKMVGHDYQTYEHATKVLWFTVAFLRLNPEILEQIDAAYSAFDESRKMEMLRQCAVGALLHDIGKAFISHEILVKTGPLTEVEWEIMKQHPLNGLAMLIDTDIPLFVKKAVLHHHEDFHGGGYPMSLEGPNITTLARVLRIIDVFDAMTSRRPYKDPMAPMKAAQIMIGTPEDKEGDDDPPQDERDLGMRRCFDRELLKKFIVFLGNVKLNA
jgi:HD-GYP domain-containing protein (c-di-GMP phosphodiesterase class II)